MNQNQLREEEQDEQERQRQKAEFRALLDKMFAFKGGKGNYTEERHQQPMPIATMTGSAMHAIWMGADFPLPTHAIAGATANSTALAAGTSA